MEHSNSFNKIVTVIFLLGLGLGLIFVYFAQERIHIEQTHGVSSLGLERYYRSISVILIFIAVLLNFIIVSLKYIPKIIILYFILISFIFINYSLTGPGFNDFTGLMDTKGIGPWLAFGLIFLSFEDNRFLLFNNFLILSVAVISLFVVVNLIEFGIGNYRGQSLSKYRVYATNLVWICPYVFLILKERKNLIFLRPFVLFIGIATALITVTRSFLLIYFLVLLFDLFYSQKKTIYILFLLFMGIFFVYFIINIESFSTSFDLLQQRGLNDTRSNQLIEFLNQANFYELIVGNGFEASWLFGGQRYSYLDNQWLYIFWWAGLIPVLIYFYLTAVIPFLMYFKKNQDYITKVECLTLILWSLGCAGLAIYSTISINFYFFVICVIQGRVLYKYSKLNELK